MRELLDAIKDGFSGGLSLLYLSKYRKGEAYRLNGVPIIIREDFTRWNSILFRWKMWWGNVTIKKLEGWPCDNWKGPAFTDPDALRAALGK